MTRTHNRWDEAVTAATEALLNSSAKIQKASDDYYRQAATETTIAELLAKGIAMRLQAAERKTIVTIETAESEEAGEQLVLAAGGSETDAIEWTARIDTTTQRPPEKAPGSDTLAQLAWAVTATRAEHHVWVAWREASTLFANGHAARNCTKRTREAIGTLYDWAVTRPLPGIRKLARALHEIDAGLHIRHGDEGELVEVAVYIAVRAGGEFDNEEPNGLSVSNPTWGPGALLRMTTKGRELNLVRHARLVMTIIEQGYPGRGNQNMLRTGLSTVSTHTEVTNRTEFANATRGPKRRTGKVLAGGKIQPGEPMKARTE